MEKKIRTFEIHNSKVKQFIGYLHDMHINYSMYPENTYWHFECSMTALELQKVKEYCNRLFNRNTENNTDQTAENSVLIIEVIHIVFA